MMRGAYSDICRRFWRAKSLGKHRQDTETEEYDRDAEEVDWSRIRGSLGDKLMCALDEEETRKRLCCRCRRLGRGRWLNGCGLHMWHLWR